MELRPDSRVDLCGLQCPFTMLELVKALKSIRSGELLEILSDRESIIEEISAWCKGTGAELVTTRKQGNTVVFLRKP